MSIINGTVDQVYILTRLFSRKQQHDLQCQYIDKFHPSTHKIGVLGYCPQDDGGPVFKVLAVDIRIVEYSLSYLFSVERDRPNAFQ